MFEEATEDFSSPAVETGHYTWFSLREATQTGSGSGSAALKASATFTKVSFKMAENITEECAGRRAFTRCLRVRRAKPEARSRTLSCGLCV